MSTAAVGWALDTNPHSASAKLILVVLADRAQLTRLPDRAEEVLVAEADLELIAHRAATSVRSVQRWIIQLTEQHYITPVHRGRENGGRAPNLYILHVNSHLSVQSLGVDPVGLVDR